jgi:hypothetical protein
MSINIAPTGIYSSKYQYSADGSFSSAGEGCIRIPISKIGGDLDATEAGQSTGDYRKLLWGLLEENYNHQEDLETSPSNMTISRSGLNFVDEDTASRSYTVSFRYSVSAIDVEPES